MKLDMEQVRAALSSASASLAQYLVRSGGECPQDWLCPDIPEVQVALCEALYGDPKGMDADDIHDIGRYLQQIKCGMAATNELKWTFEDGWLQVIKLRRSEGRDA